MPISMTRNLTTLELVFHRARLSPFLLEVEGKRE